MHRMPGKGWLCKSVYCFSIYWVNLKLVRNFSERFDPLPSRDNSRCLYVDFVCTYAWGYMLLGCNICLFSSARHVLCLGATRVTCSGTHYMWTFVSAERNNSVLLFAYVDTIFLSLSYISDLLHLCKRSSVSPSPSPIFLSPPSLLLSTIVFFETSKKMNHQPLVSRVCCFYALWVWCIFRYSGCRVAWEIRRCHCRL